MKKVLMVSIMLSSLLFSETVFDLSKQDFSETKKDEIKGSIYGLPNSIVDTNLRYLHGHYSVRKNTDGHFNVSLKKPLDKWSVTINANFKVYSNTVLVRTITLVSDVGGVEPISLSISYNGGIAYNGETIAKLITGNSSINFSYNGETVFVHANGYKKLDLKLKFPKLKSVDVGLIIEKGSDTLSAFRIVGD